MSSSKLDILYCVSHGFSLRMLLQTNLLTKLANNDLSVGIIGPNINSEDLNDIEIDSKIELIDFKPKLRFWVSQLQILRSYILEDVKGNTALWDKHLERERKSAGNIRQKVRTRLSLMVFFIVKLLPFLRVLYVKLERKLLHSREAEQMLQNYSPRIVISTYPVNWTEAILLHNANVLGINTTIHLLSWDNISCKGRFPALADDYLAWGPIMKSELIKYYQITRECIHITGVPHFDLHYHTVETSDNQNFHQSLGLNRNDQYIFFAMSAPRFAPKEIDIVEWVAEQVNTNAFGDDVKFVVRPHPQNVTGNMADLSWLERLKNIQGEKVIVDFPVLSSGKLAWGMQQGDMPHMSQLLHGAMVCLNSGSTMSIDALMVETPVIITSFDGDEQLPYWVSAKRLIDFPHLKKFLRIGNIPVANNYDVLKASILKVKNVKYSLTDDMREVVKQECGDLNGRSTSSVLAYFINKINRKSNTVMIG